MLSASYTKSISPSLYLRFEARTNSEMLLPATLQLIPASLLVFLFTAPITTIQARKIPWPFAPRASRSVPQIDAILGRHGISTSINATTMLVSVRKMGGEQGEMFFPEYWRFDTMMEQESVFDSGTGEPPRNEFAHLDVRDNSEDWANASIPQPLQAPFALHFHGDFDNRSLRSRFLKSPRAIFGLDKRQFQCPGDTTVCSSISQPNSCCPTGTVCQSITDTGNGAVGCCPEGSTCAEQVDGCGAPDTSCPDSAGGGCCIQGYTCSGVGCEFPQSSN